MPIIQPALACAVPSPKPVILAKGMSMPFAFIKAFIGPAASWGLAVNTNTSSVPLTLAIFCATLNKGPFLPSTTLLNSVKSNLAPCNSKSAACLANSVALIFLLDPFGILTITMLFDVAKVSSKSNTLIFLTEAFRLLATFKALSVLAKAFINVWVVTVVS